MSINSGGAELAYEAPQAPDRPASWKQAIACGLLVLSALASSGASCPVPASESDGRDRMRPEVVSDLLAGFYERAAAAAASGGSELTWRIANVRTLFREEFKDYQYGDIISIDQDQYLHLSEINIHLPEGLVRRKWLVEWRPSHGIPEAKGKNVAEVIELIEKHASLPGRVVALSVYDVSLRFEDREVDYGAAIVWRDVQNEEASVSFVEPVIPLIATIDDTVPLLTEEEIRGNPLEEILRGPMVGRPDEADASGEP